MCDCADKSACRCKGGSCKGGNKDAWKEDLADLYLCEPFCGNGGCTVTLCSAKTLERQAMEAQCRQALSALVQSELGVQYKNTPDGPAVVFPTGLEILVRDFCRIGCGDDDCARFGPNFNNETRVSDFSPSDVEAVAKAWTYSSETLTPTDLLAVGGFYFVQGTWRMGVLAPLGLSHTFCLEEIRVRYRYRYVSILGGPPDVFSSWIPGLVQAVAIGGVAVGCGTGRTASDTGSYVRVLQVPTEADPESIDVTPERCACEELCDFTTARGAEVFYFKLESLEPAPAPPDGYGPGILQPLDVNVKVRRCDWLSTPPEWKCINAIGNRLVVSTLTLTSPGFPIEVRAEGGAVPFLA